MDPESELSSISSPPVSPLQDEIKVASSRTSHGNIPKLGEGVAALGSAISASPSDAQLPPSNTDQPLKAKRQRKPRESKTETTKDDKTVKEKKPRKPRTVKTEDGAPAPAKKRKTAADKSAPAANPPTAPEPPRQSTLDSMMSHFQQKPPPPAIPQPPTLPSNSLPGPSQPPMSRTASSGFYDPIRGATMSDAPPPPPIQTSPHVNRASASPSITSLIDPPPATKTSTLPTTYSPQTTMQQQQTHAPQPPPLFVGSAQHSPTPPRAAPITTLPSQPASQPAPQQVPQQPRPIPSMDGAMDVDPRCDVPAAKTILESKPTKSSSSGPTPQPPKEKEKKSASLVGSGTGLLASSDLFGGPSSKQSLESRGVNIDIRITLNPAGGNTINMAQEIVKKYGRDAINPRAAAHREKLLQVAAAANRLEGGSADDMSVDLLSEADGDSNVEMGGMDDTAGDEEKPKRRRAKKVEEYDKEDDFIDDTELVWQERAAVAKDGFFVYSGPLVPEGTTAQVESSAPSGRSRGGGRGRGRGGRGGATGAAKEEKVKDPNAPSRGRGSRGGRVAAPRKPRITKADRERMEAEKAEREKMAGNPLSLAPPTNSVTPSSLPQMIQHQLPVYSGGQPNGHSVPA